MSTGIDSLGFPHLVDDILAYAVATDSPRSPNLDLRLVSPSLRDACDAHHARHIRLRVSHTGDLEITGSHSRLPALYTWHQSSPRKPACPTLNVLAHAEGVDYIGDMNPSGLRAMADAGIQHDTLMRLLDGNVRFIEPGPRGKWAQRRVYASTSAVGSSVSPAPNSASSNAAFRSSAGRNPCGSRHVVHVPCLGTWSPASQRHFAHALAPPRADITETVFLFTHDHDTAHPQIEPQLASLLIKAILAALPGRVVLVGAAAEARCLYVNDVLSKPEGEIRDGIIAAMNGWIEVEPLWCPAGWGVEETKEALAIIEFYSQREWASRGEVV